MNDRPAAKTTRGKSRIASEQLWPVLMLSLSLLLVPVARAESGEVATLRQEVSGLKQAVERLDARVESLEHQLSTRAESGTHEASDAPAPRAATPSTEVTVRDRWRRLVHGMTREQIEALLGRPDRTATVDAKILWYYSYPDVGSGSVVFTQDAGVIDWQVPPFATWW